MQEQGPLSQIMNSLKAPLPEAGPRETQNCSWLSISYNKFFP